MVKLTKSLTTQVTVWGQGESIDIEAKLEIVDAETWDYQDGERVIVVTNYDELKHPEALFTEPLADQLREVCQEEVERFIRDGEV